jgi:hypothetical protein
MRSDANQYSLEFSSALLAILLSSKTGQDHLIKNAKVAKELLATGLNLLKEKGMSRTLLYNLMIGFSHLSPSKESLASSYEESKFSEKLQDFHD